MTRHTCTAALRFRWVSIRRDFTFQCVWSLPRDQCRAQRADPLTVPHRFERRQSPDVTQVLREPTAFFALQTVFIRPVSTAGRCSLVLDWGSVHRRKKQEWSDQQLRKGAIVFSISVSIGRPLVFHGNTPHFDFLLVKTIVQNREGNTSFRV